MKKTTILLALFAGLAMTGLTATANAAEAKDVTLTGTALCAKCSLHQADKCHTVVQVTDNGKTVTYWLTGKEAKEFHHNICMKEKGETVTVTGKVTEKDGKEMLHATKIAEAK